VGLKPSGGEEGGLPLDRWDETDGTEPRGFAWYQLSDQMVAKNPFLTSD